MRNKTTSLEVAKLSKVAREKRDQLRRAAVNIMEIPFTSTLFDDIRSVRQDGALGVTYFEYSGEVYGIYFRTLKAEEKLELSRGRRKPLVGNKD